MSNIETLNKSIQRAIDNWNLLNFTKLSNIFNKANNIIFVILTYDNKSYEFVKKINDLVKTKHPYGDICFVNHDDKLNEINSTNLKSYKITVFNDKNIDEQEYMTKLEIFYNNLSSILKEYKKG